MGESSSPSVPRGDAELIGAIASGDEAAYATLRERHTAAARSLASELVKDPAEADEILSETFTRLHGALRRGAGPDAAVRPYLLAAVRRVADERSAGQRAGTESDEAGSEPLASAFLSLPERWRAVLWHTEIEQADPGEAAVLLGLTAAGVAELGEQARAELARAYLKLYLSGQTRKDCRSAAGQLDLHLNGAARGRKEGKVQRHLRGCRACRAVAVELAGLGRSLCGVVAPVFLGPATAAYLAAARTTAAPVSRAAAPAWVAGVLRWVRQAPSRMRQAPGRRAPRQRHALVAGGLLLAAFAVTGLTLTLAANTAAPPHAALDPGAAAAAPPRPDTAAPPPPAPGPARTRPAPTPSPVKQADPDGPSPLLPAEAASPAPSPFFDHHRHRHHHHDGQDQPTAP